ncbi:MAG: hypothetical protein BWY95_01836 [Bacteroidetes bacterium ADurb.BinA104]|nr:MAG: hypothetical protein BWY95_01836 [Bacteroidetes bacterium ADurb.BinA104]
MPERTVLRIKRKTFSEIIGSFGKPVLVDKRKSPDLITVDHKRVAADGTVAILFGSAVVLKRKLGYRPEEIGFIQVRLGVYYLIKILDGKHIVIVIEGCLSHRHHAVRINLSGQSGTKR